MAYDLKNRTAFITGASSGIGKAIAETFAGAGCRLIISARREDKLNDLARHIRETYKVDVKTLQLDVRHKDEVFSSLESLGEEWGSIDILVNNAGLARGMSKIQDGCIDDWEEMIDTNIKGMLYVTKAVLPSLMKSNNGHIINIGSLAGVEVYPLGNVYCGTKYFVKAISHAMKIDLNETGIRVTNIAPGLTQTEFSLVRFHNDSEIADKVYQGYQPLTGEDIADATLFCVTRPKHVNIRDILITPTAQAGATIVNKNFK